MQVGTSRFRPPPGWDTSWDWSEALQDELVAPYFQQLIEFVNRERKACDVFPPAALVFEAFRRTPLSRVRVVLLGQDPYHQPGQAHGLSFSVPAGVRLPPSLKNIFRERQADLGLEELASGDLSHWSSQGVLLLNAVLTVRSREAFSHRERGWETFTDAVIQRVSEARPFVVFLLWGVAAQKKASLIDSRHVLLAAAHPSPLSAHRGFLGSRVFSTCNRVLREHGLPPIDW